MTGYRVLITNVPEREDEVLVLRVDELHEIAPKLAALYPPPIVKRQHRRKKEAAP